MSNYLTAKLGTDNLLECANCGGEPEWRDGSSTRPYKHYFDVNPDGLPVGLTISEDGSLLNWRGENYVRQSALGSDEKLAERENSKLEHKLSNMETKLLKAQERIDGLLEQKAAAAIGGGECEVECFDDGVDEGMDGEWFSYAPPTWYLSCGHTAKGSECPSFCPTCGKAVKR